MATTKHTTPKDEISLDSLIGNPSEVKKIQEDVPAEKPAGAEKEKQEKTTKTIPPVIPVMPTNGGDTRPKSFGYQGRPTSRMRGSEGGNADMYNDDRRMMQDQDVPTEPVKGVLDTSPDGHGLLRPNYSPSRRDVYIGSSQIRRFWLRPGDVVEGVARVPKENERYWGLLKVEKVNGKPVEEVEKRVRFEDLTPVYPNNRYTLEIGKEPLSTRLIDLVAPIGKGQRGMIVSPPKAGKTTVMKEIATGVAINYPDSHVMAVLIGERPEEVTDIRRHIESITSGKGEVAASNFDEPAEEQTRVAEIALERAKRLVESGQDVVILLDSITRLARAYNLAIPTSGRTLSGGFDPAALYPPKKFFGAARNFEGNGSLTIIGTALVDTGSRMDDLIYEEFKGTGNMELVLDRSLADRRIYPAIDVQRSGTRREDLLFTQTDYQSVIVMRRMIDVLGKDERSQILIERLKKTKSNKEFLASLKEG
ncbi:MAG TPA: transcription termination factor Rho [Patescibacteria group bacterium]|nr:transcription termination factor Rho [Patescibacteria group bacterium]